MECKVCGTVFLVQPGQWNKCPECNSRYFVDDLWRPTDDMWVACPGCGYYIAVENNYRAICDICNAHVYFV